MSGYDETSQAIYHHFAHLPWIIEEDGIRVSEVSRTDLESAGAVVSRLSPDRWTPSSTINSAIRT